MSQMPGTGIGDMFAQKQKDVASGLFTNPGHRAMGGGLGSNYSGGAGGGGLGSNYSGGTSGLAATGDPDDIYASITRQQYLDYKKNYGEFEDGLIDDAQNDTSLIDQARKDAASASGTSEGIASRNASRYGASLTPAQLQQQTRQLDMASTLGSTQAVNDSRIAQREANTNKMADLINIGQGVNRSSLDQLGSAAQNATQRKNAYTQAKAASKAQTYSTIGSLGAMAIMAFAF